MFGYSRTRHGAKMNAGKKKMERLLVSKFVKLIWYSWNTLAFLVRLRHWSNYIYGDIMEKKEVPAALNTFSRPIIFFGWNILPNKLTVSRDLQHWWDFLQTLVLKRKWKKLFEILSQFWLEKSVKLDKYFCCKYGQKY